jgi:hypothetical protein
VPRPRKEKNRKTKNKQEADPRTDFKLIKTQHGSRNGNPNRLANAEPRVVTVNVQLLPETRLLLALANEEVEARRKAGQSEARIWKDCQKAPLAFVRRGFKRLLSAQVRLCEGAGRRLSRA